MTGFDARWCAATAVKRSVIGCSIGKLVDPTFGIHLLSTCAATAGESASALPPAIGVEEDLMTG